MHIRKVLSWLITMLLHTVTPKRSQLHVTGNLPNKIWVNIIVKCQLTGRVVADFRDDKNCDNDEHND